MRRWLLGIDGGGTRTRCRAIAGDGEIRAGDGGPCNWTTLPTRECLSAIGAAVACLGFAGSVVASLGIALQLAGGWKPTWWSHGLAHWGRSPESS